MSEIEVLVVDDEEDFSRTLIKRLKHRGFAARAAAGGAVALESLAREPVDVVILDVNMPDLDGIEVIGRLKQRHPLIEVILLSGQAELGASLKGMERGAFDYLIKPADFDLLVEKIQDAHAKKALQEQKIRALRAVAGTTA